MFKMLAYIVAFFKKIFDELFGEKNTGQGYIPDPPDNRDYVYTPKTTVEKLPIAFDLRQNCPPVMKQGAIASCSAHGTIGAYRYLKIMKGDMDKDYSRLQLYYDARVLGNLDPTVDSGAYIRDAIKSTKNTGVAEEALWPYIETKFSEKPTDNVYIDAKKHESLIYYRVDNDPIIFKRTLADGYPIVFGVKLYNSFKSISTNATGVVSMPSPQDMEIGGHCMYIVGYGQKEGYFTVRNSWGTGYGDKGDYYIPEDYFKVYASDIWIITGVD